MRLKRIASLRTRGHFTFILHELSKVHKILKIEFVKKCPRNLFHVLKKLRLIKVRENPHVTAEEWTWIKNLNRSYSRQQDLYTSRNTQRSGRSLETSDHQMSPTTNFLVGEAEDDFIHDSGKFLRLLKMSWFSFFPQLKKSNLLK